MEIFYKAVLTNGFDFFSESVDYASLCGTGESLPELMGGECCTSYVYHASTSKADTLIGGSWPCRLFEVEGDPVSSEENKRGFRTLKVIRELPAWEALGPNGEAIVALIERAKLLTESEIQSLNSAWKAAWSDELNSVWNAAWNTAWDAARNAAWNAARNIIRDVAWNAARNILQSSVWDAAWSVACALVVKDLITPEQFEILYGPWKSVIG